MTQDAGRRPTTRRSARGRNRPLLVTSTSTENEATEQTTNEPNPTLADSVTEVQAQNPPVEPTRRRLPSFFSTVGKKETTTQKKDVAQARITRATRGKIAPATNTTDESESEAQAEPKKASARPTRPVAPARPARPFKTRYLFGMVLYLLAANFIGIYEVQFFQAYRIDSVLAQFSLFGGLVVIRTSTLAFLATLIIILVILARFDLIPRSFAAMTGQQPTSRNRRTGPPSNMSENTRTTRPTMRQGTKGADDDL